MVLNLRAILLHNVVLKVISLLIGFICWYIMSSSTTVTVDIVTPICFYNTANIRIEAPEAITVTLQGKRDQLYRLTASPLNLHINGATLHPGPNRLPVHAATLFLPEQIKLVHCTPLHNVIIVHPENKNKS